MHRRVNGFESSLRFAAPASLLLACTSSPATLEEIEEASQTVKATRPAAMAPSTASVSTANSLRFVWGAVGDSYAAGEGNPSTGRTGAAVDDVTGIVWGDPSADRLGYKLIPNRWAKANNGTSGSSGWNYTASSTARSLDNQARDDWFTCHRSDASAVVKANTTFKSRYAGGMAFTFASAACTGAQITHIYKHTWGPDDEPNKWTGWVGDAFREDRLNKSFEPGTARYYGVPQPAQLERMVQLKQSTQAGGQLDAIYMHIGGNDLNNTNGFEASKDDKDVDLLPYELPNLLPVKATEMLTSFLSNQNDGKYTLNYWSPKLDMLQEDVLARFARIREEMSPGGDWAALAGTPVMLAKPPTPIADAQAGACDAADWNAAGASGPDWFYKQNLGSDEAQQLLGGAPGPLALSAAIDQAVAASPGWSVIPAPSFTGHGMCTSARWINLNSEALARQGRDMNGAIDLSHGQAHPNDAGYQAYADVITRADSPLTRLIETKIQAGLVRVPVDGTTGTPTGFRVGAQSSSSVTLHWDDKSSTEMAYEIEIMPQSLAFQDVILSSAEQSTRRASRVTYTDGAGSGWRLWVDGNTARSYVHRPTAAGRFKYRVRACHPGVLDASKRCASWSNQIYAATGAEAVAATPTNISRSISTWSGYRCVNTLGSPVQTCAFGLWNKTTVNYRANVYRGVQYTVRVFSMNGTLLQTSTFRDYPTVSGTATAVDKSITLYSDGLTPRYVDVAACTQAGCSYYSDNV